MTSSLEAHYTQFSISCLILSCFITLDAGHNVPPHVGHAQPLHVIAGTAALALSLNRCKNVIRHPTTVFKNVDFYLGTLLVAASAFCFYKAFRPQRRSAVQTEKGENPRCKKYSSVITDDLKEMCTDIQGSRAIKTLFKAIATQEQTVAQACIGADSTLTHQTVQLGYARQYGPGGFRVTAGGWSAYCYNLPTLRLILIKSGNVHSQAVTPLSHMTSEDFVLFSRTYETSALGLVIHRREKNDTYEEKQKALAVINCLLENGALPDRFFYRTLQDVEIPLLVAVTKELEVELIKLLVQYAHDHINIVFDQPPSPIQKEYEKIFQEHNDNLHKAKGLLQEIPPK